MRACYFLSILVVTLLFKKPHALLANIHSFSKHLCITCHVSALVLGSWDTDAKAMAPALDLTISGAPLDVQVAFSRNYL